MWNKTGLIISLSLITNLLFAQEYGQITGKVKAEDEPVAYANVGLEEITQGTSTDDRGKFELKEIPAGHYHLKVSAIGYASKVKEVNVKAGQIISVDFELKKTIKQLDEVVVTGTMKETYIKDSPIKVEVLTPKMFENAATSNVVEVLNNVNGVQEQVNCGVCGTNEIRINGMEGPYTLVMIDGMPIVSALSSVYGFNGIPTNLIERVEIVKGPASSLYGTEAVGGVVNIITKSPEKAPRYSLNTSYSTHREANVDFAVTSQLSDKVETMFSMNYFRNDYQIDQNGDNFTDVPLNDRISLFNKWSIKRKKNRDFDTAARYYDEDRFGGTLQWEPQFRGSDSIYGESIYTNRVEVLGTYQLPIDKENIRIDYSYNYHHQNSYYGDMFYLADQSVFFSNLIWDKDIKNHGLILGATYRYQTYDDNTTATLNTNKELIPGIFAQDEYQFNKKFSLLGGLRLDHHSDHGLVFAPRTALKYSPGEWTTIRWNAGKGFRTVHLFTEDHAALTGSREVVVQEELSPEISYNTNLNINHIYQMGNAGSGSFDIDLFYTYFTNKIVPDYETDPNKIIYDNLNGYGIVRGASFAFDHSFSFPLNVKAGVTFQDVFNVEVDESGNENSIPQIFAPNLSMNYTLSYEIKKWNMGINYIGNITGNQHLPTFPEPFSRPEISPWYSLQSLQVSKKIKHHFDLYAGVKNLLNYTQPTPLVDPQNPFSENFDTVYAYGPVQPRRFYIGLRMHID